MYSYLCIVMMKVIKVFKIVSIIFGVFKFGLLFFVEKNYKWNVMYYIWYCYSVIFF